MCGVLLSRGADVTLVDDGGLTAVEVAKNKKVGVVSLNLL